jgi:hypothetical protein
MRYMLLMCRDEERWGALSPQERVNAYEEALRYSDELRARGVYETGNPLEPSSTATTVRLVQGRVVTTDGPFAETKEQLGGFSIVNVKDLDEVLAIVRRHPLLRAGHSIEVRPMRTGPPQ